MTRIIKITVLGIVLTGITLSLSACGDMYCLMQGKTVQTRNNPDGTMDREPGHFYCG